MRNSHDRMDQITEAGAVTLDEAELDAVHGGAYEFYFKIGAVNSYAFKIDPTADFTFKF